MKMLINSEWLRKKFETEPEVDFEIGMLPLDLLKDVGMLLPPNISEDSKEDKQRQLEVKHAFGLMIHHLRLRDSLTIEGLAEKASVMVSELENIERDPHHQAMPRTVVQLARVFNVKAKKMISLSGSANVIDDSLEEAALKFAAKSDGVSSLNSDEQALVNDFVKYLNED